jgi:hypothetical protein
MRCELSKGNVLRGAARDGFGARLLVARHRDDQFAMKHEAPLAVTIRPPERAKGRNAALDFTGVMLTG